MATLTLTATAYPNTTPPGVRLDVTASGTPTVTSVTVTRTDQSGKAYPVRTADGGPLPVSGGAATIYDYEIPYGSTSTYSVAATGATTVTASASLAVPDVWLVNVGVPALSMPVTISDMGPVSRAADRGLFQIIGNPYPVAVTGGASSAGVFSLSLITQTDTERVALAVLTGDGSSLLLNPPQGWGMDARYVSLGDLTEQRANNMPGEPLRVWQTVCTVVGRPAGGSQSLVTWQTVYDSYGGLSWSAQYAAAGNPTWAQLANPVS